MKAIYYPNQIRSHNRTNGAVYSKTNLKSALHLKYLIIIPRVNISYIIYVCRISFLYESRVYGCHDSLMSQSDLIQLGHDPIDSIRFIIHSFRTIRLKFITQSAI